MTCNCCYLSWPCSQQTFLFIKPWFHEVTIFFFKYLRGGCYVIREYNSLLVNFQRIFLRNCCLKQSGGNLIWERWLSILIYTTWFPNWNSVLKLFLANVLSWIVCGTYSGMILVLLLTWNWKNRKRNRSVEA